MVALASVSYIFKAFINKGGSAIKKSFKTAGVKIDDIKRVNKRNLK